MKREYHEDEFFGGNDERADIKVDNFIATMGLFGMFTFVIYGIVFLIKLPFRFLKKLFRSKVVDNK